MKHLLLRLPIYSLVVGVLFSLLGCTGLQTLPASDSVFFRNKAQACLNGEAEIKDISVLNQNHELSVVITLKVSPEREEELCLKLLKAITNDGAVPNYDTYCVAVRQPRSISLARQFLRGGLLGMSGILDDGNSSNSKTEVITFSCILTKEALTNSSKPTIVIREGFFVTEPYAGQPTDAIWLHEHKINVPKKNNP